MDALGAPKNPAKLAAAWLAEKVARGRSLVVAGVNGIETHRPRGPGRERIARERVLPGRLGSESTGSVQLVEDRLTKLRQIPCRSEQA